MRKLGRKLLVPTVGLALGTGGFAFLASNGMPAASDAGIGTVNVSGYNVTYLSNRECGTDDGVAGNTQAANYPYYDYICYVEVAIAPTYQSQNLPDHLTAEFTYPGNSTSGWVECAPGGNSGTWSNSNPYYYTCDFRSVGAVNPDATTFSLAGVGTEYASYNSPPVTPDATVDLHSSNSQIKN